MGFLETLLRKRLAERPEVQWVIMDLTGVNDMDAVAIRTLEELMETYGERHIQFLFAGMKGPVRDMVARAGWGQRFGERTQYLSITHALQAIGVEEWRKL
jgi:SulP family sulfate permease